MEANGIHLSDTIIFGVDVDVAQAHGKTYGVHVEQVGNGFRFNRGVCLSYKPFSPEAREWMINSPIYRDNQARWHRHISDFGC